MTDFNKEANEATNNLIWNGLKVAIVTLLLFGLCTGIWWVLKPTGAAIEHEVTVESHQYQEARRASKMHLEQEIARLDVEIAKAKDPAVKAKLVGQRNVMIKRHAIEDAKLRK